MPNGVTGQASDTAAGLEVEMGQASASPPMTAIKLTFLLNRVSGKPCNALGRSPFHSSCHSGMIFFFKFPLFQKIFLKALIDTF